MSRVAPEIPLDPGAVFRAREPERYALHARYMNEAMVKVLHMHRAEVSKIDEELVPTELLSAAQEAWEDAVVLGEQYGVRNSQASSWPRFCRCNCICRITSPTKRSQPHW